MTLGLEVVSGDGVGDDEDFPHDSGEGDLSGSIVVVGDAIVEVAHRGGMADSGAGGVEQGAAHERSSMTGFGLPFSFSAFVGMGGEADKGGDLPSTQTAEFRQVGDERCRDDRADTAHGAQKDQRGSLRPAGRRQAVCAGRPAPAGARQREKRRRQIGAPSGVSEIAGDQHRVDPIGLGAHAASLAKGEDCCWGGA